MVPLMRMASTKERRGLASSGSKENVRRVLNALSSTTANEALVFMIPSPITFSFDLHLHLRKIMLENCSHQSHLPSPQVSTFTFTWLLYRSWLGGDVHFVLRGPPYDNNDFFCGTICMKWRFEKEKLRYPDSSTFIVSFSCILCATAH